jgi:hypothetical protein
MTTSDYAVYVMFCAERVAIGVAFDEAYRVGG